MKRKILITILLPLLMLSFLSVGYSQVLSDNSIISMSGKDWSLKVDSVLASSIDSRNTPYMTAKSATEKELFLELATLEDCKSGVVQFKIDMAGLTAYKQLPLTEEEIAEGSFRPKNVENSFALFDDSGRKVAHIYGSKITDSKGVEVWLDQNLENGLLTVILPKPEVLGTLTFPVLLDPTFGYTSIGASTNLDSPNEGLACKFNLTENGTISQISFYGNASSGTVNGATAIYNDNGGVAGSRILLSSNVTINTTSQWWNFTVDQFLAVGTYWLAVACDGLYYNHYDSGASGQLNYNTASWLADPFTIDGNLAWQLSIFATYATGEPTPTPTPSPSPTPTPEGATATPFPEGTMDDTDWWISILVLLLIIINIFLMMLPFALVRFTFGILSLFLCMLALTYQIPLSPYLQTAGLLISALAMLFSVRARE